MAFCSNFTPAKVPNELSNRMRCSQSRPPERPRGKATASDRYGVGGPGVPGPRMEMAESFRWGGASQQVSPEVPAAAPVSLCRAVTRHSPALLGLHTAVWTGRLRPTESRDTRGQDGGRADAMCLGCLPAQPCKRVRAPGAHGAGGRAWGRLGGSRVLTFWACNPGWSCPGRCGR